MQVGVHNELVHQGQNVPGTIHLQEVLSRYSSFAVILLHRKYSIDNVLHNH